MPLYQQLQFFYIFYVGLVGTKGNKFYNIFCQFFLTPINLDILWNQSIIISIGLPFRF